MNNIKFKMYEHSDLDDFYNLNVSYCKNVMNHEMNYDKNILAEAIKIIDAKILMVRYNKLAIGFASWKMCFDWHFGAYGGEIDDMYLLSEYRVAGIGLKLFCNIAYQISLQNGTFFRGSTVTINKLAENYCHKFDGIEYTTKENVFNELIKCKDMNSKQILTQMNNRK